VIANFTLSFKDSDGVAINITGYTIYFAVKNNRLDSDDDAVIYKEITSHTSPTTGVSTITVDAADTIGVYGLYDYDVQYDDSSGSRKVAFNGTFTIVQSVGNN